MKGINDTAFQEGNRQMRHIMKITVGKGKCANGVLACRCLTVREKLLRLLLGSPVKLTVLVPGDSVEAVEISEVRLEAAHEAV